MPFASAGAVREPAIDDDTCRTRRSQRRARRGGGAPNAPDKQRYREAFRAAFRAALAALSARDRNLLRMHLIDELTIDQIAALHRTHRATAARWLAAARDQVAREVRRDLMKQLGADPFEADELLQWIRSRVELSLSGLAR
jgi:RNA polymerase sigma-70 factor (ECF subfamily)